MTRVTCLDADGLLKWWPLKLGKMPSAGKLMVGDVVMVRSDVQAVRVIFSFIWLEVLTNATTFCACR